VLTHRQNDVLRLLTVFTVIVLPLTMLTGVFGMNVAFPGEGTREAFWVIVALLVALFGAMIGFFRWRRWL
jgi:magnesium transporter